MESLNLEFAYDPCKGDVPNSASNCVDSENAQISGDSQESLADIQLKTEKNAKNAAKINLAKKRLQAYCKQVARMPIKEPKVEMKDKQPEQPPSKKKRDMFHHEKAKAVIKEIEEEKRRELEHNNRRQLLVKNHQPLADQYLSRDAGEQFKKREIKQRNYRRTDSESKPSKSPSPAERRRRSASASPTAVKSCPKNWSEYKASDGEWKSNGKSDSKRRPINEILNDLYNFDATSVGVDSFKCSTEKSSKEVPLFHLKRTKAKPSVVYSLNIQKIKDSFLTREQLFELIPDKQSQIIRNISNSHSKLQPLNKKLESRPWYNKVWRKHSDAECKILENSVGLSFLQTYSDEEEENEAEEVLVCSSINNSEAKINCDEFEFTLGDEDSGNLTPELPVPVKLLENDDEPKKHAKKKAESSPKKKKKKKRKRRADKEETTESSDESKTSHKSKKKTKKRSSEKERGKRRKTKTSKRSRTESSSSSADNKKKKVKLTETPENCENDDSNTPPITVSEPKKPDWENDSLDNNLLKTKLNSSWESDEEIHEPQERPKQTIRNYDLMDLKLEIPLNIKPFKKREINNFDIDSLNLPKPSDEKKTLENEYVEFIKAVSNDVPSIPMPDDVVPAPVPHPVNTNSGLVTGFVPEDVVISTNSSIAAEFVPKDSSTTIVDVCNSSIEFGLVPEELVTTFNDANSSVEIGFVTNPQIVNETSSSVFVPEETTSSSITGANSPVTFGFVPEETNSAIVESNTDRIESKIEENLIDSTENKPLTFASLVLPAKKSLLDNSNLKLDDSDEEVDKKAISKPNKPEKTIESKKSISQKPVEETKSDKKTDSSKKSKNRERSPRLRSRDSPKRRRRSSKSPERHRDRDRDRDRDSRRKSTGGRRYSSHRSPVSYSPRRRSPRRSLSPKNRSKKRSSKTETGRKSPNVASPLEGLKRSVADSTIPDDSLLPAANLEDYTPSPVSRYYSNTVGKPDGLKRLSLDERINLELGWGAAKDEAMPISTTYDSYQYESNRYHHGNYPQEADYSTNFVQVGNMVQIVPKDFSEIDRRFQVENKSQIVQVGNVLQIVPADLPLGYPGEASSYADQASQMESNNLAMEMKNKMLERRAEKEKRKKEREVRRKEKENKRREKEKRRLLKVQQKTESMIMKALQLEVENNDDNEIAVGGDELNESATHWPPAVIVAGSKDTTTNRSILVRGKQKSIKTKTVQFADGVRPGEGTSPSAGEDFGSPPPRVLPKEKRYTKTKLRAGNAKKKVKVKIVKCNTESKPFEDDNEEDSDEEDDRSPPPPPPGSPPPHVFPPRLKTTIHPYVLAGQNQQVFNSPLNSYVHPMPDSHMQMVHNLGHYQLAAAVPPPPLPSVASSDLSSYGAARRRTHRYKY